MSPAWAELSTVLQTSSGPLCPVDCQTGALSSRALEEQGLAVTDSLLYLADRSKLSNLSRLCLQGRQDPISFILADSDQEKEKEKECGRWCSSFDLEEECWEGCHSLTGQSCLWRQSQTRAGHNYSSCSPPLASCLDGFCDTFEKLDPSLCPQDCYSRHKGSCHSHLKLFSVFIQLYIPSCP